MVVICVLLTILVCVSVDALIQKRHKPQTENPPVKSHTPKQTRFHPGHTWASMVNHNQIAVGIDNFVSQALGPIDRVILKTPNTLLIQGDPMLDIERGSRSLQVRAPMSGIIKKNNPKFWNQQRFTQDNIKTDDNWLYTIQPIQFWSEWPTLKMGETAQEWLENEGRRLANWLTEGHTFRTEMALQDGGLPAPGILQHLNHKEWQDFQTEFLDKQEGGDLL